MLTLKACMPTDRVSPRMPKLEQVFFDKAGIVYSRIFHEIPMRRKHYDVVLAWEGHTGY